LPGAESKRCARESVGCGLHAVAHAESSRMAYRPTSIARSGYPRAPVDYRLILPPSFSIWLRSGMSFNGGCVALNVLMYAQRSAASRSGRLVTP
jgi:hypothetical protein